MLCYTNEKIKTATNIGFAIWRVKCFFETLLLNQTLGIFSNIGAKNPPHRKAEKRYQQFFE